MILAKRPAADVPMDIRRLHLVNIEAVRFLVQCETQGVQIARCPAYVREWMAREKSPSVTEPPEP